MQRRTLAAFTVFLFLPVIVMGQRPGEFVGFSYPQHAEAVRLGGLYTAVGRGLATVDHNPAALAFQHDAQATYANGLNVEFMETQLTSSFLAAASVYIPSWQTSVALEHKNLCYTLNYGGCYDLYFGPDATAYRSSLHIARELLQDFAVGLSLHRYGVCIDQATARESGALTNSCWDASVSAHGRMAIPVLAEGDELRFGIAMDNLFSSEFYYIDEAQKEPLHQVFRFGAAWFCNPDFPQGLGLDPLSFVVTVEGSVHGTEYAFDTWGQYGAAMELRLLEVLMLSAGVEDRQLLAYSDDDLAFPVFRWGFGFDIPLHRVFWDGDTPVHLQLDYARSDWSDDVQTWYYSTRRAEINNRPLWSLQLRAPLL